MILFPTIIFLLLGFLGYSFCLERNFCRIFDQKLVTKVFYCVQSHANAKSIYFLTQLQNLFVGEICAQYCAKFAILGIFMRREKKMWERYVQMPVTEIFYCLEVYLNKEILDFNVKLQNLFVSEIHCAEKSTFLILRFSPKSSKFLSCIPHVR